MNKEQKKALKKLVESDRAYRKVMAGKQSVSNLEAEIKYLTEKLKHAKLIEAEDEPRFKLLLEGTE